MHRTEIIGAMGGVRAPLAMPWIARIEICAAREKLPPLNGGGTAEKFSLGFSSDAHAYKIRRAMASDCHYFPLAESIASALDCAVLQSCRVRSSPGATSPSSQHP